MKNNSYVYPAILSYESDGISIEFPDLPGCLPCANNIDEAIKNSKEAMALHLYDLEESNKEIPEPSSIDNIKLEKNETLLLVKVNMSLFRDDILNGKKEAPPPCTAGEDFKTVNPPHSS
ncbi:type II toxin-antitoxin system HicB family antitoxin [Clostridium lacusfryxellense]|uniref:type II toxin-antitoxin system HicB family antitoxin n=1 Tax=Clostridium lacusfryxellense TaxID=205328 RepID=UPI001C0B3F5A|nr:type II toxin-antitoxin system HicB family antitoxin [Clostridium lacusfryxellense]MBU3114896.1 type II toxin-antitoxin system HicB family antitoxin [Clostridium lacusfryxellense]